MCPVSKVKVTAIEDVNATEEEVDSKINLHVSEYGHLTPEQKDILTGGGYADSLHTHNISAIGDKVIDTVSGSIIRDRIITPFWTAVGWVIINKSKYEQTGFDMEIISRGIFSKQRPTGTMYGRLFNVTDNEIIAGTLFSETDENMKIQESSNIYDSIPSYQIIAELQMKREGATGVVYPHYFEIEIKLIKQ